MYDSIQQFNEFGVKKIEETIKKFVIERKDMADLVIGLQQDLFELGRNIITEVLEKLDEELRQSKLRKKSWEIVRKDSTSLLTSFGEIRYSRTYYRPKSGGIRQYLIDSIVGIKPHERVSSDVVINTVEEAIDSSYRKAGEAASYVDGISKQAVMDKVHQIQILEPELDVKEKRKANILYIEADEDHVSLQQVTGKDEKRKYNTVMPKLVYVHEGIDTAKSSGKRKVLKNVRYFGGDLNSEELWLKVSEYIDKQYDEESIETIYISGDGASWIRQGCSWINKSRFVLDNYHLNKYVKAATVHLNNKEISQELRDALDWPDRKMLKTVFKKILSLTESETKREVVKDARRYMLNNWDGIVIKAEKGSEIIGCSAEGHVSHVFSDRLSSRPKGWSKIGVSQMSQLLIYKKNGGKIYDLVMAQKLKESKDNQVLEQESYIKSLRKSAGRYYNSWNSSLTAVATGQKTGLYRELRNIIGRI
jgi:hypothetical protein